MGQSSQNPAQNSQNNPQISHNYPQISQQNSEFITYQNTAQGWPQIIPQTQFNVNQPTYRPNWPQQWSHNSQLPPNYGYSQGFSNPSPNYSFSQIGDYGSASGGSGFDRFASLWEGAATPGGNSSTNQNEVDVEDDEEEEEREQEDEEDQEVVELEQDEDDEFEVEQTQQTFSAMLQQPPAFAGNKVEAARAAGSAKTWSLIENEALVSAYMNISCDEITGTNQTRGAFWKKVVAKYDEIREANAGVMPWRTPSSLRSRWQRLAEQIMKWVGCYDEATRRKTSGCNENDVLRQAHMIYENTIGSRFLSEQCWKQLIQFPKWKPVIASSLDQPRGRPKKMASQGSGSSGKRSREEFQADDTGPVDQDCARPEGVKKAKATLKGKGKKVMGDAFEAFESFGERLKIHADARIDSNAIERERLQLQRERLEEKKRQRALEEYRINWDILTALRSNPDRSPDEEQMLAQLNQWFKNYKRI